MHQTGEDTIYVSFLIGIKISQKIEPFSQKWQNNWAPEGLIERKAWLEQSHSNKQTAEENSKSLIQFFDQHCHYSIVISKKHLDFKKDQPQQEYLRYFSNVK